MCTAGVDCKWCGRFIEHCPRVAAAFPTKAEEKAIGEGKSGPKSRRFLYYSDRESYNLRKRQTSKALDRKRRYLAQIKKSA